MASLLLVDAGFGFACAALFALVGAISRRGRAGDEDTRKAGAAFSAWWAGFALLTLANAAKSFAAGLGATSVPVHVALAIVGYAFLCVALWGLTSYLAFIYRGKHDLQPAIRAYFAALFVLLLGVLTWTHPIAVETEGWTATLVNERPLTGAPLLLTLLAILGPPPVLAAAYARLYKRASDPAAKRRIALVSGALVVWFGLSILANATALATIAWWPLAARGLAMVSTLALLYAYA